MTNTSTTDNPNFTENKISDVPSQVSVDALDQMLSDIRSGRRLERVVDSIKNFLEIQVTRVGQVLEQCESAVDNDRRLQNLFAEFEKEKQQWNQTRQAEIERLSIAGDKIAEAWADLETERRKFLDSKSQQ